VLFTAFWAAIFGTTLSSCDFIDGLLGKSGDSGGDNTEVEELYKPAPGPATANGGVTATIPVEGKPSLVWEIHTFTTPGTYTLGFSSEINSLMADYLIVAGGGGSGGDHNTNNISADFAGGGGAGGLLYKTGELPLIDGSVQVIVGAGGTGGARQTQGNDGGNSVIGNITVRGGGGGGGAGNSTSFGTGGTGRLNISGSVDNEIQGNNGGAGQVESNDRDPGSGGGGAGSAGGNKAADVAGAGGDPWVPVGDALWLTEVDAITPVGESYEFSRGGRGGDSSANAGGTAGVSYGDGGSAGKNTQKQGGNGHSGIVVIRFQRPLTQ
jgi:hypothetical protein